MSDIRTKILMGTTISAVSLMLVMAIGISSVQNSGSIAGTSLGIVGHFEIMVENPDGSASYVQADNFINGAAKTNVGNALFTGATLNQPNDCIILGTGTPDNTSDGITTAGKLGLTGVACSDAASPNTGSINCNGSGDSVIATAEQCVVVTKHVTDTDCAPCNISEAAIGTGVTDATDLLTTLAYTGLTATITANVGATVTTTYKVAIAGDIVA